MQLQFIPAQQATYSGHFLSPQSAAFKPDGGGQPSRSPRFGRMAISMPFLREMDFSNFGETFVRQSMLIYTCIIASRMIAARSKNERLEVLRRDVPGWYMWFMGKPLFEYMLTLGMTANNKTLRALLSHNAPATKTPFEKFMRVVNPAGAMIMTTYEQLQQRERQIRKLLPKRGASLRNQRAVDNMFRLAKDIVIFRSFLGLVLTIAALGIGIPQLNVILTRKNVEHERRLAKGQLA